MYMYEYMTHCHLFLPDKGEIRTPPCLIKNAKHNYGQAGVEHVVGLVQHIVVEILPG